MPETGGGEGGVVAVVCLVVREVVVCLVVAEVVDCLVVVCAEVELDAEVDEVTGGVEAVVSSFFNLLLIGG